MKKNPGFSLLELIVVITLVGLLAVISIPGFQDFQQKTRLDSAVNELQLALNEGFSRSRSGPFSPLIFIDRTEDKTHRVEICDRVTSVPTGSTFIDSIDGGEYKCSPNSYKEIFKNLYEQGIIIKSFYTHIENKDGAVSQDLSVEKLAIIFSPPFGNIQLEGHPNGVVHSYPENQSSYALKKLGLILTSGKDERTITISQTGLIEKFNEAIYLTGSNE